MSSGQPVDALPPGTRLLWYEILRVLGKGGFGITYLARDTNLDQWVAIKEYLPVGFAVRGRGNEVLPSSDAQAETYEWGLERFLKEAQVLARFRHSSIVRVLSFFRDSNTAYMVMEYEDGESLESVLKRRKVLPEAELRRLMDPLLGGLETLHNTDYIHRDIKPPNIFIRKDGSPVILDFGSARQAVAGQQQQMTSLLSLGYSPFEQYDSSGSRQGPWSDIYSMSGVLYRAVTGQKPVDAAVRIAAKLRSEPDPMKSTLELGEGRYSFGFLKAIDKGLMVLETDRPQSIGAWRPLLLGGGQEDEEPSPRAAAPVAAPSSSRDEADQEPETPNTRYTERQDTGPKKKVSTWRSFVSSLNEFGNQLDPLEKSLKGRINKKVTSATTLGGRPPSLRGDDGYSDSDEGPEPGVMVEAMPTIARAVRKAGDLWVESLTGMEFVWIPGGTFQMGSAKGEPGRKEDEGPLHEVELDGFWMGKYPVTWMQWKRVMGDPRGFFTQARANYPVERVLWDDTQNFLRKFARMVGGNYRFRLPTEAEWEYGARAGAQSTFFFGDDIAMLGDYAWFAVNAGGETQPVGLKAPNPWGLYDILGNVWEWTEDWYGEDYYEKSPRKNPRGAPFGEIRVRRGGSWRSSAFACRIAHRNRVGVNTNSNALGFRLVRLDT